MTTDDHSHTQPPPGLLLDKRDWIAGLERGEGIIEAFDDANPRMTASQAGQRTGMTRTAARRYLLTLQHMGYVASDGKLFWLTPRVLRLDPDLPMGYARDLEVLANTLPPERHLGYAVQWFALSAAVLVIALLLTLRARRRR